MAPQRITLSARVMVGAIIGAAILVPAFSAMANDCEGPPMVERHAASHIEGHIAFLRAELKITPAQEALWDTVAVVMRADVSEFEHPSPQNLTKIQMQPRALQHLEERALHSALQAKSEQRFLDAFRPLYDQLSDAQKHVADELLGHWREDM